MDTFVALFPYEPYRIDGEYRCDDCYGIPNNRKNGSYRTWAAYTQHMKRIHKQIPRYKCRLCDEVFIFLKCVNKHYREQHAAPDPNADLIVAPRRRRGVRHDTSSNDDDQSPQPRRPPAAARRVRQLRRDAEAQAQAVEQHVRDLVDVTNEIAEVRAEVHRDIDQSRTILSQTINFGLAASTPLPAAPVERPGEPEISALLDRLTTAAAQGDDGAWDSILQESLRPRRRRRAARLDHTEHSGNGGASIGGDLVVSATAGRPEDDGGPEGPPEDVNEGRVDEGQQRWIREITQAGSFEEFEDVVRRWIQQAAPRRSGGGPPRPGVGLARGRGRGHGGGRGQNRPADRSGARGGGPGRGRPGLEEYDPVAASKIQSLYRRNRKKAMNQVLGGEARFCQVDGARMEEYYRGVFSAGNYTVGDVPQVVQEVMRPQEPAPADEVLVREFTPGEVLKRLGQVSNTAPGPDGVPYWALKKADPGGLILAAIFNRCLSESRTPASWKEANTVLIYKKGDPEDLDNWRPLTLASCVSKLYTGLLATRIHAWAGDGKISWPQKGFMEHEGCFEHNLVVRSAIDDARRGGKRVVVAWLDLSNAFGSVPHAFLLRVLQMHGMPQKLIAVVEELYHGASTKIRSPLGYTNPIPMAAGVKQGDPLSPILFNLAMEPVVRAVHQAAATDGYRLCGRNFSIVAYADDLALIAAGEEQMRRLLQTTEEVAAWAGLRFNPRKCASLDVDCRIRRRVLATEYTIGGTPMGCLKEGEEYSHLGVPTGFKNNQTPVEDIARMAEDIKKIDQSLLAPWQKLEAVRTFVLPRLDFVLRGARVAKSPLKKLDNEIKRLVKKWLYLPQRASAEVVYLGVAEGGAGMFPLADLVDISSVVHAFRMITCKDAVVRNLARDTLFQVARKRIGRRQVSADEVADYLSGRVDGDFARDGGDIGSLWSDARNAAKRLQKKIGVYWRYDQLRDEFQIRIPSPGARFDPIIVPEGARKALFGRLKNALRRKLLKSLTRKPDQGKAIDVSCRSRDSNHFIQAGKYTRFADWRFIFRARLGTVPLNGCRRWGQGDRRCRRCGEEAETLPHVLNHCEPTSEGWRKRHNAVLDRLVRAIPSSKGSVRVDLTVPGVAGNLRPDLVLTNEEEKLILIVDVVIPFENRYGALAEARRKKFEKYEQIADELRLQGYRVTLDGFVVGALGSWDSANEGVIKKLGISPRYAQTMRRLMVSDAIRWSRDIYVTHLTGQKQW